MRSVVLRFAVACVALALSAACAETPTMPSGVTTLIQTDLSVGAGAVAATGNSITVHYTGWLYDDSKTDKKGIQFETSVAPGREPFTFTLGAGNVIPGWDQGIISMKVGGTRRLIIPPSLAYGPNRNGPIPPNATLVFDIELVSIQ